MGLTHGWYTKEVFVDGHEQKDVIAYRNEVFLLAWKEHTRRFVIFAEDGSWSLPSTLQEGEKPLVLVTYNKSIFSANDGKRQGWMVNGKQPLRPKNKGKGIMISGFRTPGGQLFPDHISDSELLCNPMWVSVNNRPV